MVDKTALLVDKVLLGVLCCCCCCNSSAWWQDDETAKNVWVELRWAEEVKSERVSRKSRHWDDDGDGDRRRLCQWKFTRPRKAFLLSLPCVCLVLLFKSSLARVQFSAVQSRPFTARCYSDYSVTETLSDQSLSTFLLAAAVVLSFFMFAEGKNTRN